ncbi:MAG TPA: hypothetical protein VIT38_09335 [Allosphingosinicella sp.]
MSARTPAQAVAQEIAVPPHLGARPINDVSDLTAEDRLERAGPGRDWGDLPPTGVWAEEMAASRAVCRQVRDREPPASDRPDPATVRSLAGCSPVDLYYGIGIPANPVRARLCAFARPEDGGAPAITGRAMLMTIYANGVGAERDLGVATHLACGLAAAPAESHERVTHLTELRATHWQGRDFHFCDDITSGESGGLCAELEARLAEPRRAGAFASLTAGWPAERLRAFQALQRTHAAYVEAHQGATFAGGTDRVAALIEAGEQERDRFLDQVRELVAGHVPLYSAEQVRRANRQLAWLVRDGQREGEYSEGMPGPAEHAREEAAWRTYRDAFIAFAQARDVGLARERLATWLARPRLDARSLRDE